MKTVVPPYIQGYSNTIQKLSKKAPLMGEERRRLNINRLKVAKWSCECEGLPANVLNLRQTLGPDADEAFKYFSDFVKESGSNPMAKR